jgi:hypothetical protein
MPRNQTTWAKLTLAARERFRAAEEREDKARVEAEKASTAEGKEQAKMDPDIDEEEGDDGWHDATKDAPPRPSSCTVASLETSRLDVVHEHYLAAVKAIIDESMVKLSRAIIEAKSARLAAHTEGGDLHRRACPAPAPDALARLGGTLQGGETRGHRGARGLEWRAACQLGNRPLTV